MGPRRYELNRELEFGRPFQLGATPFAESPALAFVKCWTNENINQKQKNWCSVLENRNNKR
jgi:hypothetical protein